MSRSGIETICVNAKAMRFAIMSPNHKVIKEQTCEQSCTFSTADECFIMKVSESPVTAFPPSLRQLGGGFDNDPGDRCGGYTGRGHLCVN